MENWGQAFYVPHSKELFTQNHLNWAMSWFSGGVCLELKIMVYCLWNLFEIYFSVKFLINALIWKCMWWYLLQNIYFLLKRSAWTSPSGIDKVCLFVWKDNSLHLVRYCLCPIPVQASKKSLFATPPLRRSESFLGVCTDISPPL